MKNGSQNKYGYLRTQVNCLQAQIVKLNTLVRSLTDRKNQLHEQKESIRKNLQLCSNEISADGNITPDTLPCTVWQEVTRLNTKTKIKDYLLM